MSSDDTETMRKLEQIAGILFDGHFTVMRFTTNWRVGFGTPSDRDDIQEMAVGKTFAEAAEAAMNRLKHSPR